MAFVLHTYQFTALGGTVLLTEPKSIEMEFKIMQSEPQPLESHSSSRRPHLRTVVLLVIAIALAVVLNQVVALVARNAGAGNDYAPLTLPVFGMFTVVGILAGWAGWVVITRLARRPRRILAVLVPIVALVSFVPDVALLMVRFIPGTTTAGVLALVAMHLVVMIVALPAYVLATRNTSRSAPVQEDTRPERQSVKP